MGPTNSPYKRIRFQTNWEPAGRFRQYDNWFHILFPSENKNHCLYQSRNNEFDFCHLINKHSLLFFENIVAHWRFQHFIRKNTEGKPTAIYSISSGKRNTQRHMRGIERKLLGWLSLFSRTSLQESNENFATIGNKRKAYSKIESLNLFWVLARRTCGHITRGGCQKICSDKMSKFRLIALALEMAQEWTTEIFIYI